MSKKQDKVMNHDPVARKVLSDVAIAKDFLDITTAGFTGKISEYLASHQTTAQILNDMNKPVESVLGTAYWSTTPYKFGDTYAKYKVVPCNEIPAEKASLKPNYLRERLERDLKANGACFKLQVQLRTDETIMPLDQTTVEWSEGLSVPQTVATILIPPQDIKPLDKECDNMSFTAWHALPEHAPVGSVNQARGIVYKRMADLRRKRNHVPIAEPKE